VLDSCECADRKAERVLFANKVCFESRLLWGELLDIPIGYILGNGPEYKCASMIVLISRNIFIK
jgi:hypothetical protein